MERSERNSSTHPRDDARRRAAQKAERRLHICPRCDCDRVHPLHWQEAGSAWNLLLRCPDCDWRGGGVFGTDAVVAFDAVLERALAAIAEDLRALAQVNMAHDVERFVLALEADAILPDDF